MYVIGLLPAVLVYITSR